MESYSVLNAVQVTSCTVEQQVKSTESKCEQHHICTASTSAEGR